VTLQSVAARIRANSTNARVTEQEAMFLQGAVEEFEMDPEFTAPERLKEAERQLAEAREALGSALSKMGPVTEKECEACQKNRKGVYATPFGADHHHARIAELEQERDSMEVSRDLAEAEELKTRKERDSALERVKELERAYRQREEALQNLVVFREGERDSAREELGNLKAVEIPILEDKLNEARAAIRAFIADFEINGSLPNYALNRLRRVLDSMDRERQR